DQRRAFRARPESAHPPIQPYRLPTGIEGEAMRMLACSCVAIPLSALLVRVPAGVLLLPSERVETSPGRRSVVRRFLVTCLGEADEILRRLYAQLRELGWMDPGTVVVIVGDGAEWIWNRATMFVHRCEILDFWHALEHAWTFARLRYGEDSAQADCWVHGIAEDLRAGKVQDVIAALPRLRPKTAELRESLQSL